MPNLKDILPKFLTHEGRTQLAEARALIAKNLVRADSPTNKAKSADTKTRKANDHSEALKHARGLLATDQKAKTRLTVAGLGLVALGGIYQATHKTAEPTQAPVTAEPIPVQRTTPEVIDPIARGDQLIAQIESGFTQLKSTLEHKLGNQPNRFPAQYIDPASFWAPFELVARNHDGHPNRNYLRFRSVTPDDATVLRTADSFFYVFERPNIGAVQHNEAQLVASASYTDRSRVFTVPASFNQNSLLEMIVAYHEMRHCVYDSFRRTHLQGDALRVYLDNVNANRSVSYFADEADAYAYEIEALNILLDDHLRQANGNLTIEAVMQTLNAHTRQDYILADTLLTLARLYYPQAMQSGRFAMRYLQFLQEQYMAMGLMNNNTEDLAAIRPFQLQR